MTGIMDQLRNWTADKDQGRTDFDDLGPATYTRRVPKNMVRIVEGADDLRPTTTPVAIPSGYSNYDNPTIETRPIIAEDGRTARQTEVMMSLISQLAELDHDTAEKATEYTTRMTVHNAWTPGRDGNASAWIGRMIAKVRELKFNRPVITTSAPAGDDFSDVPNGHYALHVAGIVKFYRVRHGKGQWAGRTFVDACASDARHPIRNRTTCSQVLEDIRAMGWKESMGLYGQELGHCGRCHRELTDETSRSIGIGPECRKKM